MLLVNVSLKILKVNNDQISQHFLLEKFENQASLIFSIKYISVFGYSYKNLNKLT